MLYPQPIPLFYNRQIWITSANFNVRCYKITSLVAAAGRIIAP